jgi:Deacetylase PdaC/Protein of unknown function (DUF3298)
MKKFAFASLLFSIALITWFSCGKTAPKPTPITFESVTVRDSLGKCSDDGDGNCFQVSVNYLVAKGGDAAVAAAISDTIQRFVIQDLMMLASDSLLPKKVDAALKAARTEYEREVKAQAEEEDPFRVQFNLDVATKELYRTAKSISIEQQCYIYSGGAHPNSETRLLVFNTSNGKMITLKEIVKDSVAFMKIVEENLRKVREIPANQSLHEAGFLFDEILVALPQPIDYCLTAKGLKIIYNPYEIAAYAMGPTEMEIPISALEKVLNLELLR